MGVIFIAKNKIETQDEHGVRFWFNPSAAKEVNEIILTGAIALAESDMWENPKKKTVTYVNNNRFLRISASELSDGRYLVRRFVRTPGAHAFDLQGTTSKDGRSLYDYCFRWLFQHDCPYPGHERGIILRERLLQVLESNPYAVAESRNETENEVIPLLKRCLNDDGSECSPGTVEDVDDGNRRFFEPADIRNELDRYVIGQGNAKRVLASAASQHYFRTAPGGLGIKKSNVLLMGPTGSGKSHLIRSLAGILDVPFITVSATSFTATGFVGRDVSDMVRELVDAAGNGKWDSSDKARIARAQRGIVFIDEIDKICKHGTSNTSGSDINGEAVQQALLTILEGTKIEVAGSRNSVPVMIDTANILFILGGAFPALPGMIRERLASEPQEDSNTDADSGNAGPDALDAMSDAHILKLETDEDLEKFFIPEFIGRIPVKVHLDELSVEELVRVLTEPEGAIIKSKQLLFKVQSGSRLTFTDASLRLIAERCYKGNRGARGLAREVSRQLELLEFVAPSFKQYNLSIKMDAENDRPFADIRFGIKDSEAVAKFKTMFAEAECDSIKNIDVRVS